MKASIKFSERRTPTLWIDEKPVPPVLYGLSDIPGAKANTAQAERNIKAFSLAGIKLIAVDTGLHLGWRKHSPFDPEALREEIASVLDAEPNAGVLLRLHMNPPYFWLRDHPEECVVYRTEEGDACGIDDGESDRLIRGDGDRHMRASLASKRWITEASEKLRLFLQSLDGTPEGEALVAIQVAGGVYGEWHQWGMDVSRPMQDRFIAYLKETYHTTQALRHAWGDDAVTFETASFHPEKMPKEGEGGLREPRLAQKVIDARRAVQLTPVEAILAFAKTIKETAPSLLVGTFYGYYFGGAADNTTLIGHLFPSLLYKARGILDFMGGPFCYFENRKSEGVPMQRTLLESCRLNGILWLTEMDQHPIGTEQYIGGDPAFYPETISLLRRNTLQPLLSGHGFWYYDHRIIPSLVAPDSQNPSAASVYRKKGWWDSAILMQEIAKIQKFANKTLQDSYSSFADVLLVYDTESFFYRSSIADEAYKMHESLMRAGVIYDCVYKSDLPLCALAQYTVIIYVNCHYLTEQDRSLLYRLAQGHKVICMNACGICNGEVHSMQNLSQAVGMSLCETDAEVLCIGEERYTIKPEYRPVFAIEEDGADPLAHYENGQLAAAEKNGIAYISLPYLPPSLAKKLLSEGGAHIYTDSGEPVFGGYRYLCLCCQRPGERRLILPSGKTLTVHAEGFETMLFDIESGDRIL